MTNSQPAAVEVAQFVGRSQCGSCHERETENFIGSHHDLAMQVANEQTVLGDFDNADFDYHTIQSTFFKKGNDYFVRTDGPDGQLNDYQIQYTFGVYPLQQYLIPMPGGRLQALNIVWDSRSAEQGGQRWYHLYPDEKVKADDPLHWTKISHNWNYMCAECHSTDLHKNYNTDTSTYDTQWSEIDVSCEACHGPASLHVSMAQTMTAAELNAHDDKGFEVNFERWSSKDWLLQDGMNIASLGKERDNELLIDNCGRCHARRTSMNETNTHAKTIHDAYVLAMLDPDLYYADGQIDDEVYVYGSFLQSKMHRAGVNCLDCHEPHSLKLRAEGNALCLQCHDDKTYNTTQHHFHQQDTESAACVSCHMPAKNYMVIDSRRDHSFRIPRPDLTIKTGAPNACNQCHADEDAAWALKIINEWYPDSAPGFHYGEALYAARIGAANADVLLLQLVNDENQPAIARATAIKYLGNNMTFESFNAVLTALKSDDALLKLGSIETVAGAPIGERYDLLKHLLTDKDKAVRIAAANMLAAAVDMQIEDTERQLLNTAIQEYIAVQQTNAERGFAHVNLGNLYLRQENYPEAESAYKHAIEIEPEFMPAHVNLADLYRRQGREELTESILTRALSIDSSAASVHHALGLSLVRQKKYDEALAELQQAYQLNPDDVSFTLVYAIALRSAGRVNEAFEIMRSFQSRYPDNGQILMTLSSMNMEEGNFTDSLFFAEKLQKLLPNNTQIQVHIQYLEAEISRTRQ